MESNDTVEEETATEMESTPAPESKSEVVAKAEKTEQGDIILKLVSYSGSIIKMMTVLSSIDGIDEEEAFHILQKLPSVVREGITAKTAMKIGAILEEAGAVVDLKRASDSVAEAELPKSAPVEPESEPEPQPEPEQPKRPPMEYVDLGLSVKWAKWNLGASAPEEIGDYFAWGECEKKDFYYWDNYKFCGKDGLLKYNYKESYGSTVDKIKELELSDDAAHQILGEDWRMPTIKEFEELKENCTLSYTSINGVKGLKYRSKKKGYTDRWIFLPYTGFKSIKKWYFEDKCFYWTSTLYTRRPDSSIIGIMVPVYEDKMDRYEGLCIRPVTK